MAELPRRGGGTETSRREPSPTAVAFGGLSGPASDATATAGVTVGPGVVTFSPERLPQGAIWVSLDPRDSGTDARGDGGCAVTMPGDVFDVFIVVVALVFATDVACRREAKSVVDAAAELEGEGQATACSKAIFGNPLMDFPDKRAG